MQPVDSRIKVFVRSRPLGSSETIDAFGYSSAILSIKAPGHKGLGSFSFDKVFPPHSTTDDVFETTTLPIIYKALEGYNGTIFAYGQTTSGKTHTMIGNLNGVIPKTLNCIFENIQKAEKIEYKIWISYLEIYNEIINDLLDTKGINLKIREDPSEGYFVAGLKRVPVHSNSEAIKVLETGEKQRSYRATNIHEHSSRSHSVFRIIIESKEIESISMGEDQHLHLKGTVKFSIINLVDLAGSERMSEVGDTSETSHINKSLFVLTNVINKLSEASSHVPYRDSKLTRVLCNSLGGNALTSIICTIAPDISHMQLSLSTLRFAMRAKCIKNDPKINEILDDSALLLSYKNKIVQLEMQITNLQLSKNAEIKKLQQQVYTPCDITEEKTVEFVNISELGYLEKYKELQKNFNRQFELKNSLLAELADIKRNGVLGFDVERSKFENNNDCSRLEKWNEECSKLRDIYMIEIAGINERYYGLLQKLYSSLNRNNTRQTSISKPSSRNSRPASGSDNQNLKPDYYRIRKHNTTSTRGRSKPAPPYSNTGNKKSNVSPSPFVLHCEDLSNADSKKPFESKDLSKPAQKFELKKNPSQDFFNSIEGVGENFTSSKKSFDSFNLSEKSPRTPFKITVNSEDSQKYTENQSIELSNITNDTQKDFSSDMNTEFNPPPSENPETTSIGAVPIELEGDSNIIMFGFNKDGCCGDKKFGLFNKYYNLNREFKE